MLIVVAWSHTASGYTNLDKDDVFDASRLRIDEGRHLGAQAEDVSITTISGEQSLAALMADQPTILLLAYYQCGHTCPVTIQNLARLVEDAELPEHRVVVASFDGDDTLETMRMSMSRINDVPDNWTFGLLSEYEAERLTRSVGFKFFFSEADQTFVHPAVLVFLSPQREVTRYLYGASPSLRDVELALIESRKGQPRLNEFLDMIKLTCFHYDAARSRYVLHPTLIFGAMGFGLLGLAGLAAFVFRGNQGEGRHGDTVTG